VAPLLGGWRGSGALDRPALAHALATLGGLLAACPELREIEINPLRVYENGVLALDALFR
jgi:acetyltransferase